MDRKAFFIILVVLLLGISAAFLFRSYRPQSTAEVDFSDFPLVKEGWVGEREEIPKFVIDLLKPKAIFSGNFTDTSGQTVFLLFDFFISDGSFGGPHSPRNCLPGGGWSIDREQEHLISVSNRSISGGRFSLSFEGERYLMDFWYITNYGETASDYKFKLYSMLASINLRPREVGFVRIIVEDTQEGIEAMEAFEQAFVPEIYDRMPFE